jgi:hypothetical protein
MLLDHGLPRTFSNTSAAPVFQETRASCSWKPSDTTDNKENEISNGGVNENASKEVK